MECWEADSLLYSIGQAEAEQGSKAGTWIHFSTSGSGKGFDTSLCVCICACSCICICAYLCVYLSMYSCVCSCVCNIHVCICVHVCCVCVYVFITSCNAATFLWDHSPSLEEFHLYHSFHRVGLSLSLHWTDCKIAKVNTACIGMWPQWLVLAPA